MRYINLLVALVLSFALIGTAACTSTDDDLSGSAVGTEDDSGLVGGDDGSVGGGDDGSVGGGDDGSVGGGDDGSVGGDKGGEKPGKGDPETAMALELLSRLASKINVPMNLKDLLQAIEMPAVAEGLSAYIEAQAADGNEAATTLVGGGEATADGIVGLLEGYMQTLGGSDNLGGDAGAGGDDNVGGDPDDVRGALDRQPATQRTAAAVLEDACGNNQECLGELQDFRNWVNENIDDLDPTFANFENNLSRQQISGAAPIPATFPQVQDVQGALEDFRETVDGGDEAAGGDEPIDDGGLDAPETAGSVLIAVAAELGDETVDWRTLNDLLGSEASDPEVAGNAVLMLEAYINKAAGSDATATALQNGESVAGADAATLLEAAAQ